ncbi:MAG: orotate phosphoribosyltransferase [Candidatus Omnitrophota bacterium]
MTDKKVLGMFKKTGALLTGHFKLSSGLHSQRYLQCALVLQRPEYAGQLCSELAKKLKKQRPTVIVAPALGGVLVSYEVARAIGCRSLFTEREEGKMTLRRGFSLTKKDRVVVVEDVITTGGSTREVIEVVTAYGAKLVGVGSIVHRASGEIDFGVPFEHLLRIAVETFDPATCPFCKERIPLVKPGSRKT